jgi:hypothetical protein
LGQIQHTWGKYSTLLGQILHTCTQYGKYCTLLAFDVRWLHTITSVETRLIAPHFTDNSLVELVLCPMHYTEVHKQLCPQSCASCGLKPIKGTRFVRCCPDTTAMNQVLFENAGSTQRLRNSDHIFPSCYKSHLVLKSLGDVNDAQ